MPTRTPIRMVISLIAAYALALQALVLAALPFAVHGDDVILCTAQTSPDQPAAPDHGALCVAVCKMASSGGAAASVVVAELSHPVINGATWRMALQVAPVTRDWAPASARAPPLA